MSLLAGVTEPIRILADGTIKQVNPFSGTQVWTVPGRGNRPLGTLAAPRPIDHDRDGTFCAFCSARYLETPPEKARLVVEDGEWRELTGVAARDLSATVAEFRRIPNLFEIMSLDYWEDNHDYTIPPATRARMAEYLADPEGRAHVLAVARAKAAASGVSAEAWDALSDSQRLDWTDNFFAGAHDVIVARRHFADGATTDDELASSGSLTPDEHERYMRFTIEAMSDLYRYAPQVRYVATFQNWLRPAGASFDHLHKQLVAIDERGAQIDREYAKVAANPNIFNDLAVDYAADHGLLLAENEHAIAYAGFGHRYPTLEVYSKAAAQGPWEHSREEVRAVSDLLHACHAATGAAIATNEEWYHRAPSLDIDMPWRIMLKWRVSTLAGFEGGTKINVNTISPFALHDRVLARLLALRGEGRIADMRLGDECAPGPNCLRYGL